MVRCGTYSGCASTLPSTPMVNSLPKVDDFTLAGERMVSWRFWPVRKLSLCHVSTLDWENKVAANRAVKPLSDAILPGLPARQNMSTNSFAIWLIAACLSAYQRQIWHFSRNCLSKLSLYLGVDGQMT